MRAKCSNYFGARVIKIVVDGQRYIYSAADIRFMVAEAAAARVKVAAHAQAGATHKRYVERVKIVFGTDIMSPVRGQTRGAQVSKRVSPPPKFRVRRRAMPLCCGAWTAGRPRRSAL